MRLPPFLRPQIGRALAFALPVLAAVPVTRAVTGRGWFSLSGTAAAAEGAELVNVPRRPSSGGRLSFDSLVGRSGQLRARLLSRNEVESYPDLVGQFGADARLPGVHALQYPTDGSDFAFITLKPWREKSGTFVNRYHVGWWPGERRRMPDNYENPVGFVEVTPGNEALRLSTHFRLRDFVTHDQERIWPKYVVLREELLDKLELVLIALEQQGVPTRTAIVLSGFRTPQYNLKATFEGAAYASRHQYGDAADLIIDADRDGRMDDLNRDGIVDFHDTDVINRAVERVERSYPDLVGGLGLYHATGPRGPFAHIDVRGTRARWSNAGTPAARRNLDFASGYNANSPAVGRCKADAASAALCVGIR